MADTKVSALTPVTAATGALDTYELPLNAAGASRKATAQQVRNSLINEGIQVLGTGQAFTAATRTYMTGSKISVPAGKLRAGSFIQWRFNLTKTAAGSAASTLDIAIGTLGTTGDAAILSFTKPAGTAAADEAWCTVDFLCTAQGAGSRLWGEFVLVHNLAATGHALIPVVAVNATTTFDTSTASLIVGLCLTTGAADAVDCGFLTAQAYNL